MAAVSARSTLFPYTTLFRSLLKGLLLRGAPIDGVGLQMHVDATSYPQPADIAANVQRLVALGLDRKSTRLNSSHVKISYAVFCLKKKKKLRFLLQHE